MSPTEPRTNEYGKLENQIMSNEERQEAEGFKKFLDSIERGTDKFGYKVPKGHADEGKEFEKAFTYPVCETDEEVDTVLEGKGWDLKSMVNDALKANARSNAYQLALAVYKTTRTPEALRTDIIKDLVRLGFSEEVAAQQVDSMLAAQNA